MSGKILITGGAGLIGSTIADQLARQGRRGILLLDNFVRGRKENVAELLATGAAQLIEGDIRDRDLIASAMDGVDTLYHQAAIRITQCAEDPRLALEVLVDGTFNVLEAAVRANVRRVVAASSASVYGTADVFPTTELHHPYNNNTFYGSAKTFNEGMLRSFHAMRGLRYVVLRYFNVYGPKMDIFGVYTEVLVRWMERIERNDPPLIFGDGSQTMDFIYSEDIARANILAAESDVSDEILNVATGVETSLKDLAYSLLKVMDSSLEPEYREERKVAAVRRRWADTSKTREKIGFVAEISLEEGLKRLVDWWRKESRHNS